MENTKITLYVDGAFEVMFELLKAKQWLLGDKAKGIAPVAAAEFQAVTFLVNLQKGKVNEWGNSPADVQKTVTAILIDLLTKFKIPIDEYAQAGWQVTADAQKWQQALEVVCQEIARSHPHLEAFH